MAGVVFLARFDTVETLPLGVFPVVARPSQSSTQEPAAEMGPTLMRFLASKHYS